MFDPGKAGDNFLKPVNEESSLFFESAAEILRRVHRKESGTNSGARNLRHIQAFRECER